MSTPNTDYVPAVMAVLRREGVPLTPREVADWAGIHYVSAYATLRRLQREGMVDRNDNNYWYPAQIDGSGATP
jgi:DNA-binding IclR family transcriptional regulator